jgi:LysR family transcriptional regulator for bpeEF and oprC
MNIELVQIFVNVVRSGGFTKAAEILRLPKSTVSKSISRLEDETKTKLLLRTTRTQKLTAAGRVFYDSCVGPIQAIEDAQKSLSGNDSLLTGTIKITAPEDLGTEVIAPAIGRLIEKHPGLNFELIYTDQVLDLITGGYDLAVRIGNLKESNLKVKKSGEINLILVASPEYLKKNQKILKPEDLIQHACLALNGNPLRRIWLLKSKTSQLKITVNPRIQSNQMSSLLKAIKSGAGLSLVPDYLCRSALESGELIHILPNWSSPGLPISILSPLPFSSTARLRMVADYIAEEIQKVLS